MATDPKKWIYGFINAVPGIISAPARWIADRIFGTLEDGVAFAKWLKSGFDTLLAKGKFGLSQLASAAEELATTLRWLVTDRIPKLIAFTISGIKSWASSVINTAVGKLNGLITTLRSWATTAINAVKSFASNILTWATARINSILDKLRRTVDTWYERLTDPKKFATWLIGALMALLLAYVYANREKILRWALRSSPAATAWLARELEKVLEKLL